MEEIVKTVHTHIEADRLVTIYRGLGWQCLSKVYENRPGFTITIRFAKTGKEPKYVEDSTNLH